MAEVISFDDKYKAVLRARLWRLVSRMTATEQARLFRRVVQRAAAEGGSRDDA